VGPRAGGSLERRSVPYLDDRKYGLLESIEAAEYFSGNIFFTFKLQLKQKIRRARGDGW
jgi:hypothetical protein